MSSMHGHTMARSGPEAGVGAVVSVGVLVVGLAVTAAEVPMAWVVWPLGYGLVLPLAVGYAKRAGEEAPVRERGRADGTPDSLERAKAAYVAGEIDETEFERRVEAALEDDAAA